MSRNLTDKWHVMVKQPSVFMPLYTSPQKRPAPSTSARGSGSIKKRRYRSRSRGGNQNTMPYPTNSLEVSHNNLVNLVLVGGRLALFSQKWTFFPWAHSLVSRGLGWRWSAPPPRLRRFYQHPDPLLLDYFQTMIAKGAIEPCKHLAFQGRLFSVPRRDFLERRVILDLSP